MVEKRKLPWGALAALLVGLLVISYFVSGLAKIGGVTLTNWQDKLLYIICHPFHNWWNDLTFTGMGIALIAWIGIVSYLMDYYRNRQIGVEYGSEQWADIKQIQRTLMNKEETKNTLLSQNVAVDNGKLSNMNMLVIGNSGSYKSTSLVIPNALLASMTNVFLDIKGELLRKTGKYLQNQGVTIKVFNLINPEESDRWNPFVYIRDEVGLVKLITNLQEAVKPPDAMKGDPFWDQAVSLYLMSLFSYEWLRQEREKKEHPEQYQAATLPRVLALANLEMQPGSEENSTRLQEKMDDLAGKYGADYPPVRDYRKLKGNMEAQETVSCVILMVNSMLRLCEIPAIKRILEADDMDIKSLGIGADGIPGKKTALFLVMPDNDPSFNFLISMFYTTMFDVLIHAADHEYRGALPIHVRLWADEFYAGPKPTRTEVLMGTIRGRNMSIIPILQSIAQAKALFPQDKWEIFIENCAVLVYMGSGPAAKTTHKFISELIGEMTIDVRNDGRTYGAHGNANVQNQKLGRSLMTPAAVKRMNKKNCILFIEGQYPVFDQKAIPFQTPRWKEMEKLAGEDGYHHSVKVIFDEEQRAYFTIETKKQIQFLSKEQSEAYKEMAKKDDTIYYREIEKEAFLYLNFRKYPKPTEEEITKAFQVERQARQEQIDLLKQQELPEDVKLYQEMEGQESPEEERESNKQKRDLSGSILDCMERYHTILSKEQKEIMIESLEKGLTEEQVKHLMFYPAEKMYQYQRAFLLQNSSQ
jgi:type IV secretion system protein VirD4